MANDVACILVHGAVVIQNLNLDIKMSKDLRLKRSKNGSANLQIWNRPTKFNGENKTIIVEISAVSDDNVDMQTVRNAILSATADLLDQMDGTL